MTRIYLLDFIYNASVGTIQKILNREYYLRNIATDDAP